MPDRFLVTGALGCVGAWTVRALVDEGVPVVAYDLDTDPHRLRLIMKPDELKRVTFLSEDITNLAALERALDQHEVTHVVHLAALQVPFCREDPVRGAQVNVVGTTSVFEAVKRRRDGILGDFVEDREARAICSTPADGAWLAPLSNPTARNRVLVQPAVSAPIGCRRVWHRRRATGPHE